MNRAYQRGILSRSAFAVIALSAIFCLSAIEAQPVEAQAVEAQAVEATAQSAEGLPPAPGFGEVFSKMMPMFAIVFLIFYFMVIKPQQTKLRAQEQLLGSLKKGDQVVTTGGIIGRVAAIESDAVSLDLSNSVKLKVEKHHVAKRYETKSDKEPKSEKGKSAA